MQEKGDEGFVENTRKDAHTLQIKWSLCMSSEVYVWFRVTRPIYFGHAEGTLCLA